MATTVSAADINFPRPSPTDRMSVAADHISRWTEGTAEVWLLQGKVSVSQGQTTTRSNEGVLWIERGDAFANKPHTVSAYLEGDVSIKQENPLKPQNSNEIKDQSWFGRFTTFVTPDVRGEVTQAEPLVKPGVYERGVAARYPVPANAIRQTQFAPPAPGAFSGPAITAPPVDVVPPGTRRVRAFARSNTPVQAQMFPNQGSNEWVAIINSGVTLIVDGMTGGGAIDVSTDRLVVWTAGQSEPDFTGQQLQRSETPLELYMEGNIEFRQGDRLIRASAMYYDVRREIGVILNAEALTPLLKYQGLVRLRAEVMQQVARNKFTADNALFTTSRIGDPTYALEVKHIEFTDNQRPVLDPVTGLPALDPATGQPVVEHESYASADSNFLDIDGIPVFYWPYFAGDVTKPIFYIERVDFKSDNIFGFSILTDWDVFQILGFKDKPKGLDWTASFDYFSKRGPGDRKSVV